MKIIDNSDDKSLHFIKEDKYKDLLVKFFEMMERQLNIEIEMRYEGERYDNRFTIWIIKAPFKGAFNITKEHCEKCYERDIFMFYAKSYYDKGAVTYRIAFNRLFQIYSKLNLIKVCFFYGNVGYEWKTKYIDNKSLFETIAIAIDLDVNFIRCGSSVAMGFLI